MEEEKTKSAKNTGEEKQEEQPITSKNIVTVEDAGPCKKKIIIEVPEETIKEAIDDQYKELGHEAVLPGFRKGRAPRRLLEKRFGKETAEQVKLRLIADCEPGGPQGQECRRAGRSRDRLSSTSSFRRPAP